MCDPTGPDPTGDDLEPQVGIPDTGDVIDPDAADPDPDEVTDPDDPSYVEPWHPAGDGAV